MALPACVAPADTVYQIEACARPALATSTAQMIWNASKIGSSCVLTNQSILPVNSIYDVPCSYLAGSSTQGVGIVTLTSLNLLVALLHIVLISTCREKSVIKARQWQFQLLFCVGVMVAASASLPTLGPLSNNQCFAVLGLFSFGYILCLATLTVKLWRVHDILAPMQLSSHGPLPMEVMMFAILGLLMVNAIFLGVWFQFTPQKYGVQDILLAAPAAAGWGAAAIVVPMQTCYFGSASSIAPWLVFVIVLTGLHLCLVWRLRHVDGLSPTTTTHLARFAEYGTVKTMVFIHVSLVFLVPLIGNSCVGQLLFNLDLYMEFICLSLVGTSFASDILALIDEHRQRHLAIHVDQDSVVTVVAAMGGGMGRTPAAAPSASPRRGSVRPTPPPRADKRQSGPFPLAPPPVRMVAQAFATEQSPRVSIPRLALPGQVTSPTDPSPVVTSPTHKSKSSGLSGATV